MFCTSRFDRFYFLFIFNIIISTVVAVPQQLSLSQIKGNATFNGFADRWGDVLDAKSLTAFPAGAWLGHGIDMTAGLPQNIYAAIAAITTYSRLIDFSGADQQIDIPGDITWTYPGNIRVSVDVHDGGGSFQNFKTGSEAFSALKFGGSLEAKYKVVKGDASLDVSLQNTYKDSMQYGMFDFSYTMLNVEFDEWNKSIAIDKVKDALHRLPHFTPASTEVIRAYRDFFSLIGTHIVVGATYGSRLSYEIRADNSDEDVNKNFAGDINFALDGLPFSGEIDADISDSKQFKSYLGSASKQCSCNGGDIPLGNSLCANGGSVNLYDVYTNWTKTANKFPEVSNFDTVSLSSLMAQSKDDFVFGYATDIANAYEYLLSNPQIHKTPVRLAITADWAQVNILSPSAYIEVDPNAKPPAVGIFSNSDTKISWESGDHAPRNAVTIDFFIRNIGDTVSIELSHGSWGATPGEGEVRAYFANGRPPYIAKGVTDNNWNTKIFDCPVDPRGHDNLASSQPRHVPIHIASSDSPNGPSNNSTGPNIAKVGDNSTGPYIATS